MKRVKTTIFEGDETMAERLNILGVGIDCIDSEEALTQIENFIADGNPHQPCKWLQTSS